MDIKSLFIHHSNYTILFSCYKIKSIVVGGKTRAESAYIGFSSVSNDADFIAIHDGARCLVTPGMIDSVIRAAYIHSAATAASAVSDTLKKAGESGIITDTISRSGMYCAQTPQVFSRELYGKATQGVDFTETITDDNMLIERIGGGVFADFGDSIEISDDDIAF